MFREDYIVRMIAQAASAISKVLGLKDAEQYPQAQAELELAFLRFSGLSPALANALPVSELVELARWGEQLDVGKLVVLADLIQSEGDLYAAQGQPAEAEPRYVKALELLLEVSFTGDHNLQAAAPRIAAIRQKLDGANLPDDLREWLAHYTTVAANVPPAGLAGAPSAV